MKTNPTTPFAMRCTQEQFDDTKEELKEYVSMRAITSFDEYPVLIFDEIKFCTNCMETDSWIIRNKIPVLDWDKSLFLKMAGKPDPESRELNGYKRNPDFDITVEQLAGLLGGTSLEKDGLYFWEGTYYSQPFLRSVQLGIVGEGKWLVPVYKQEEPPVSSRITGTYEQQKG